LKSASIIDSDPPAALTDPTFRIGYMSVLGAAIGCLSGVIAYFLYNSIALITNLSFYHVWSFHFRSAVGHQMGVGVILVPVFGGLVIGLMAKYGTSKIRGHGIPEAMEAVLTSQSRIEPRVAFWKPLSSAIAIGTGGPFGAEGPIIQTGGAFGSLIGQMVSTTASERKVLLACGAGAGLAAMFNAPITGVLLAIELLLFEFRARSFIPLVLANTLAVAVRLWLFGDETMFHVGVFEYNFSSGLPFYLLLGIICGVAAVGFAQTLRKLEHAFDSMKKIPELFHPAIGALVLGIVGYFLPRVFGPGYDTILDILNMRLTLTAVLLILFFKALVVLVNLGSGTSGGTLAPMFMISAAIGSAFAMIVNWLFPSLHLSVGAYAVAAMGALLCASARATFTFMVCAMETTRDFHAVLPIMLVCVVADAVAVRYLPTSIMMEKFARRGIDREHEYEMNPLKGLRVSEVMSTHVATTLPETPVRAIADRFTSGDLALSGHRAVPIVDAEANLVGLVTQGDVLRSIGQDPSGSTTALDAGSQSLIVSYPDERVFDAVIKMLEHNIGRLPVVQRSDPRKLVGYINRASAMGSWRGHLREESIRDNGWLRGLRYGRHYRNGAGAVTGRVSAINGQEIQIQLRPDIQEGVEVFTLATPVRGIFAGDEVRVDYRTDEQGRKIALRVVELSSRQ
jgi:CIC family chloride channel protein